MVTLAVSVLGAYAVSRLEFFGKRTVHFLFLSVYLFPPILLAIPLFVAFSKMGLRGELWVLVIVYVAQTLPICVYMLRNYFDTVPISLEEAAEVDGATRLQVIRKITLPLAVPAIAATGLFVFMIAWNEFLFALLFLGRGAQQLDRVARRLPAHEHRDAGDDADGRLGDPDRADHRAVPVRRAADDRGAHARAPRRDDAARTAAEAVLARTGRAPRRCPSGRQYPHQWGWDAAYIAIGWSWVDPARAAAELESLLRGQWPDGRVPHIVFHPDVPEDAYFPGPAFWEAASTAWRPPGSRSRRCTRGRRWRSPSAGPARRSCGACSTGWSPQHEYLAGRRDVGGGGLAAIVHPWESGLDDSPAWDAPLAAVELPAEGVEPYERQDRRPRRRRASGRAMRRTTASCTWRAPTATPATPTTAQRQFLVEDPLFNAIWLWSTHALVEIAVRIGEDAGPHREAAARIHGGAAARGCGTASASAPRDLRSGRCSAAARSLSLAPLLDPGAAGRGRAAPDAAEPRVAALPGARRDRRRVLRPPAPEFEPRRYWRGPVWANLNWLLARGLRRHGLAEPARRLERGNAPAWSRRRACASTSTR